MTRQSVNLRLEGLSKRYGDVQALAPSTLEIPAGKLVSLLGPSGCGKTTTLRVVAGFEVPDTGSVIIGDVDVTTMPTNKRGLGMVFQNYSLFPHMTVSENIAFGLKMRKVAESEITQRVGEMLDLVQLPGVEKRFPNQLSGGQQQRIALARSLVTNPSILLLDEPLGALDKNLRETMQFELRRIQNQLGITTILVTHDQEEALTLSDQVVVMKDGELLQVGTPSEVYESPNTQFVSEFLGTANLFDGETVGSGTGQEWDFILKYQGKVTTLKVQANDAASPGPAKIAIRPEKLSLTRDKPESVNQLNGVIRGHVFRGSYPAYEVEIPGRPTAIFVYDQAENRSTSSVMKLNENVYISWKIENAVLLND